VLALVRDIGDRTSGPNCELQALNQQLEARVQERTA